MGPMATNFAWLKPPVGSRQIGQQKRPGGVEGMRIKRLAMTTTLFLCPLRLFAFSPFRPFLFPPGFKSRLHFNPFSPSYLVRL
jgi:hypothetical protein